MLPIWANPARPLRIKPNGYALSLVAVARCVEFLIGFILIQRIKLALAESMLKPWRCAIGLEYKLRSLIKLNYKLFLDMHMLREGGYIHISSGQLFYDGSDPSLLLPDTTAHEELYGIQVGQVWQSPFRNWVYESGVSLDGTNNQLPPNIPSGVYIEGAFRATNDPTFGHSIDFINGRIIFNSQQNLGLRVHATPYSAREVRIGFEHSFNQQFQNGYLESKYTTNPSTSMQLVYPSGNHQPFPAVFIEVDGRDFEAYELGNRSAIISDEVKLHVWALDDLQRDNIVDILTGQWRKSLPMIDFNRAPLPLSGVFNTLSPEYVPYQQMLRNPLLITTIGSGVPIRYISCIDDVRSNNLPAAAEYERAIVTYTVKIFLNAPITPLGHIFGPITTIPTIQDPGL